jgi:hypothetical protein
MPRPTARERDLIMAGHFKDRPKCEYGNTGNRKTCACTPCHDWRGREYQRLQASAETRRKYDRIQRAREKIVAAELKRRMRGDDELI